MVDHLTKEARSVNMRRIKSRNTSPEMTVRRILHQLGFRFRLHRKDLPGSPDIILPRYRKIVLVHGCFWHAHACPKGSRVPKSNQSYWSTKISRNMARDKKTLEQLYDLGWDVTTVWECELKNTEDLKRRLERWVQSEASR